MNEPRNLVGMADEIRRKLRADDEVDRLAVGLAQIDQPPRGRMREDLLLRIPLERNADELGLISVGAQLLVQRANVVLGAAVHERNLDLADDDAADMPSVRGVTSTIRRDVLEVNHAALVLHLRPMSERIVMVASSYPTVRG